MSPRDLPPDYGKPCRILLGLMPPLAGHQKHDININKFCDKIPWCALVLIDVPQGDLTLLTQRGLFWTTQNFVLLANADKADDDKNNSGQQHQDQHDRERQLRSLLNQPVRRPDLFGEHSKQIRWPWRHREIGEWPWRNEEIRSWRLREFPNRPAEESRWTRRIILFAHDWTSKTMANFDWDQLTRRHIYLAEVRSYFSPTFFRSFPPDPKDDTNELSDHPATNIWWLWSMESITHTPHPISTDTGTGLKTWVAC